MAEDRFEFFGIMMINENGQSADFKFFPNETC